MPELPEVETVRRTLKNFVLNKKIISIDVLYPNTVSYTHLRAHETGRNLVCRLLLEKKKSVKQKSGFENG